MLAVVSCEPSELRGRCGRALVHQRKVQRRACATRCRLCVLLHELLVTGRPRCDGHSVTHCGGAGMNFAVPRIVITRPRSSVLPSTSDANSLEEYGPTRVYPPALVAIRPCRAYLQAVQGFGLHGAAHPDCASSS